MIKGLSILSLLFLIVTSIEGARLAVSQNGGVPQFFPGVHQLSVLIANTSTTPAEVKLSARLYQASSATVMPFGKTSDWKKIHVLTGQTIVESLELEFPNVRSETLFEVRFLDEDERVTGQVYAEVFPTNLLKRLPTGKEGEPIAVIDPQNLLKPLLNKSGVSFEDLETNVGFDAFQGRLVLIGPFLERSAVPDGLRKRLLDQSGRRLAFVWMQPPTNEPKNTPPLYVIKENASAFAIMKAELVDDIATSPKAQKQLIEAARLAINPDQLQLPKEIDSTK